MSSYSQARALKALTTAALRSIAKSPSSVVFTLAFPLIFILVFGFLGGKGFNSVTVAVTPGSDTANEFFSTLRQVPVVQLINSPDTTGLTEKLVKGEVAALMTLKRKPSDSSYSVLLQTNSAQADKVQQFKSVLEKVVVMTKPELRQTVEQQLHVEQAVISQRNFKSIDFILPGQLGFSLLAASVFGTAFVFFNLRQTLVLKRFFATPVKRSNILIAEGLARMIFQVIGAMVIILVGKFVFGYTLIHGFVTFVNMLLLCIIALMVFMSFGFIISGLARSESTIPPLANIITLPQFLLAGTFFSVSAFPQWLQYVSYALPLTYFNNAMRAVAFEGASLWAVKADIGVLLLWGIIGYAVATRVFKWE